MSRYELIIDDCLNAHIIDTIENKTVALCTIKRPDLQFDSLKKLIELANAAEDAKNPKPQIIWNEDGDMAFGAVKDFKDENEFISAVKQEFAIMWDGQKCEVGEVEREWMMTTGEGLPEGMLMPITDVNIDIAEYYAVDVFPLDEYAL